MLFDNRICGVRKYSCPGTPLNFDRVRMVVRLPAEERPVLADQDVDDRRFQLHVEVANAKGRVDEELRLTHGRQLVAEKVHFEHRAGANAVPFGRANLEADARVANAEGEARVRAVVGRRPGDERVAGGVVEALGRVDDVIASTSRTAWSKTFRASRSVAFADCAPSESCISAAALSYSV